MSTFSTALSAWRDNTTRTPVASANKSAARLALLDGARYLVSTVNSNPLTTDAQRAELGIRARKRPTPVEPPTAAPILSVVETVGRTVTFALRGAGRQRGKAPLARGASVFTFVGTAAPSDTAAYAFEGLITKTSFTVSFEERTEAATVWVSACWYTETGRTSMACSPISVNLPAAVVRPMAGTEGGAMKIAA